MGFVKVCIFLIELFYLSQNIVMYMTKFKFISMGFWAAGAVNIQGVLLFSFGFTNDYLSELFPSVMSPFGLILILLWGFAYISVAKNFERVRGLVAVFAVEKMVYVISWIIWIYMNFGRLPEIFNQSAFTGLFYVIYGPNDFLFGVFFAWVFWDMRRNARK